MAYSDASDTGFVGYVVELGREVVRGEWSADEAKLSSTWRELKAIQNVLASFAPKIQGHRLKWFTDNHNEKYIVANGSKWAHLQDGALRIFETCLEFPLRLEVEWILRLENEMADSFSRIVDFDDWGFPVLRQVVGPTLFCLFLQCPIAAVLNPGSEAADAFTVSWLGECCWLVPPLPLFVWVLKHAKACSAVGTLIIPAWNSAPFICPDGQHLANFVHTWGAITFYEGLILSWS